jgi:alpha-tubulin suppressor-like RCC1 family protein
MLSFMVDALTRRGNGFKILLSLFSVLLLSAGCGSSGGGSSSGGGGGGRDYSVNVASVAAGYQHSLALSSDGKVYATGEAGNYQLGSGSTSDLSNFTLVLDDKDIVAIAAGPNFSLALAYNGTVYAAGYSVNAPFAPVASLSDKDIVAIAAGGANTVGSAYALAVDSGGKVYAMGDANHGKLGTGNESDQTSFVEVASLSGINIKTVAAGEEHSFALAADGTAYVAGYAYYGKLGLGGSIVSAGEQLTFTPVTSLSGKNIIAISAGEQHSLAVDADGNVYAAGNAANYRLGSDSLTDLSNFTAVLSGKNITAVSAGSAHSLALAEDGTVYAAGDGANYRLGSGATTDLRVFTEISSLSGKNIIAISAGDAHSLAISDESEVYSAGNPANGRLGTGGTTGTFSTFALRKPLLDNPNP